MLKKILKFILDIIFPIECVGCGKSGSFVCDNCFNKIEINKVEPFKNDLISQVHIASSYHQNTLRQLIHFFKYQYIENIGRTLSKIMISYYEKVPNKLENPIIIPVPLHKIRLRERCFNQAQILGKYFSEHFEYQMNLDLITRKINTKHQADLKKAQRLENIKNAFFISDENFVKNKNFLIIDDVYTTGSTVLEMAKLLKSNGANNIWCLVIAKN